MKNPNKPLKTLTLDDLYDHAFESAERMLEKNGGLSAMYLCVDRLGGLHPVVIVIPDDRSLVVAAMRQFFEEHNIVRYAFMCEGWQLEQTEPAGFDQAAVKKLTDEAHRYGRIANHPDRIEVVQVLCEEKGRTISGTRRMLREGDKVRLAPASEYGKARDVTGMITGLFEEFKQ